jgi:hypothetical protein
MTNLFHIPEIIFRDLRGYFIDDISISKLLDKYHRLPGLPHYFHDDREEGRRSWRNFLNVSKSSHWKNVKKDLIFMSLNRFYSFRYLKSENYRNQVLAQLRNPSSQLSLSLQKFNLNDQTDLQAIYEHGARYLCLAWNEFQTISSVKNVYELDLSGCDDLTRIDALENVKVLRVKNCYNLEYLPPLVNVDELSIVDCEGFPDLNFITAETHLKSLYMSYTSTMGDFSTVPLDSLEYLFMDGANDGGCPDFTAFRHCKELSLSQCHQFTDLTPFKNLTSFDTVSDVENGMENLRNVTSLLGAFDCYKKLIENNFSLFSKVKYFSYASNHSHEFDLSSIQHIPYIALPECSNNPLLAEISLLKDATMLDLTNSGVTDVSQLGKVKYLCLMVCRGVKDFTALGRGNIELSISHNNFLSNVSNFGTIRKVSIEYCIFLKDITGLETVPYLSLKGCSQIENLSILGNHQKQLDLTGCTQLKNEDLHFFKNISDLTIHCCPYITDLSMLTNVVYLRAVCCTELQITEINGCEKLRVDLAYNKNLKIVTVNADIHALSLHGIRHTPELYIYGRINSVVDEFDILFCGMRDQDVEEITRFGFDAGLDFDGNDDDDEDDDDDDNGEEDHDWEDIDEDAENEVDHGDY